MGGSDPAGGAGSRTGGLLCSRTARSGEKIPDCAARQRTDHEPRRNRYQPINGGGIFPGVRSISVADDWEIDPRPCDGCDVLTPSEPAAVAVPHRLKECGLERAIA